MIKKFIEKFRLLLKDKGLRNKVLFVLGALIVFRILAAIPIPGVNNEALDQFLNNNQFFGLINIFSGGGLSALSIVMLGVGPYITASIIMQLITIISPKLKELFHESGAVGKRKFSNYSRLLTVPLATIQSFAFIMLLQQQGVLEPLSGMALLTNLLVVVTGSILLMWVGELITEFGIGNGVSLIIFSGIVASLPGAIQQILYFNFSPDKIPTYLAFVAVALVTIIGVVFISEAERPIPITYARQVRSGGKSYGGGSTYLPLRLNQAGVIPIIFALSILMLPQMVLTLLSTLNNEVVKNISSFVTGFMNNQLAYGAAYFLLVFLFTYFYTAVTFDPESVAKNLQRSGAFIPGVRPGETTNEYISNVLSRITFFGAIFLGLIAILPIIVTSLSGITSISVGGTSLLIAVSVIIDLVKKVDGQVSLREY